MSASSSTSSSIFSISSDDLYQPVYECDAFPAEPLERYENGGYHPVHLGDAFKDGRYEILSKLGWGSYATTWLARDFEKQLLVAIKILISDAQQDQVELMVLNYLSSATTYHPGQRHVVQLLDNFEVAGPNGVHTCLVLELTGQSVASKMGDSRHRLPAALSRIVSRQMLVGLDYLHQNGITHNDLHVGNILLTVTNIDRVPESELLRLMGSPLTGEVRRCDNEHIGPEVPRYLVHNQHIPMNFTTTNVVVKIADFGEACFDNNLPASAVNTPLHICAPELLFDDAWDHRVDIWSAGVAILELTIGSPPYSTMLGEKAEVFSQMVSIIGKFPERWREVWMSERKERPKVSLKEHKRYIEMGIVFPAPLEDWLKAVYTSKINRIISRTKTDLSLKEDLLFSSADLDVLVAFLRQMLCYEPSERVLPAQLLEHAWFVGDRPSHEESFTTHAVKDVKLLKAKNKDSQASDGKKSREVSEKGHTVNGSKSRAV